MRSPSPSSARNRRGRTGGCGVACGGPRASWMRSILRPRQRYAISRPQGQLTGRRPGVSDTILETEHLTREFGGFVAVDGVALKVREGTIHALIGPNGAGKTTCFNLLTAFLPPTRG